MFKRIFVLLCFVMAGLYLNSWALLFAANNGGETTRITRTIDGTNPNRGSQFVDMSANGRYIAYASDATNLAVGDDNNASDIFVYDRETNETERVSVRSNGGQANGSSYVPAISDDGRYVAFQSFATNLVDGDSNNVSDIFFHDRQTNETKLVSFVIGGVANDFSLEPEMSGNGRYIVFQSYANNLTGEDNNGVADIFLYNREAITLERVSLDSNEVEGNGDSSRASISDDGSRIAFQSSASNLVAGDGNTYSDIFLRDRSVGVTIRLSVHTDGTEGNGSSSQPAISGDGNFVAFASLANNLVDTDSNLYQDIFVRVVAGNMNLVSKAQDGTLANKSSHSPSISDNGRYVSFETSADTLLSGDGNGNSDIYVVDRDFDLVSLESVTSDGVIGNFNSKDAVLSGNGRQLAFASEATNLVVGDTNEAQDIFFHERFGAPSVEFNHTIGSPGSQFVLTGQEFVPNTTAQLAINKVSLGNVTIANDGSLTVLFDTNTDTDEGTYVVVVTQDDDTAVASFRVANDAPSRPPSGSGFAVPDGIAYQNQIFLPLVIR